MIMTMNRIRMDYNRILKLYTGNQFFFNPKSELKIIYHGIVNNVQKYRIGKCFLHEFFFLTNHIFYYLTTANS
ncbi:hypothetical protein RIR_jg7147.t1 [Rhizophagus irregularis DAOM 181602=DAOM 197198]|nr:hypothetical protein RhiirB3_42846 [Rhizophagus irregularis]GET64530.1 hypothetical protein RIR_jg7147.t1 [Rhizophagus irregularis DAOM 181602=DAOM 197198]